jgi:hypothetical protein
VRGYLATAKGAGAGFGWKEVLATRVVVVLGEPGSGKTWELRCQTDAVRKGGGVAFFVRLDRLVDATLQNVISPDDEVSFRRWLGTPAQPAHFLLDSVDEAKLRRHESFGVALDNFVRDLPVPARHRASLVISSRISEWRPDTDRFELQRHLDLFMLSRTRDASGWGEEPDDIRIVELEPLDRRRVRLFAEKRGLERPDDFVEALDTHHAWDFAGRPIDVAALIDYWREHGRLGSLTELIADDLARKLRETTARERVNPLSPGRSREGVECLAAAVAFCRRPNFRVPDDAMEPAPDAAMDARDCLPPDWQPREMTAVLDRAVFDGAAYGRIRFHHRRVTEYLAAQWLEARVRQGCPIPVVEDLLFARHGERLILRPSLAPITAWLACGGRPWDRAVRDRIREAAPDLLLRHGDPECLPTLYKRELLQALVDRYGARHRAFIDVDAQALARIADPVLAPDIVALLRDQKLALDLRIVLLRLVRHGRLTACMDAAIDVIADSDEPELLKSYAAAALRDAGELAHRRRLANIVKGLPSMSSDLCGRLCEALYPRAIDARGLAELLRKATEVPRRSSSGLPYTLREHLKDRLPAEQSADLLRELLQLAQEPPHVHLGDRETPISERFFWVGDAFVPALVHLLGKQHLESEEADSAARALLLLADLQQYGELHPASREPLQGLVEHHPAVRRACFWLSIGRLRKENPEREPRIFQLFDFYDVVRASERDVDWLVEDIRHGADAERRRLAMHLAVDLWRWFGRKRATRREIKHAVRAEPGLRREFRSLAANGLIARLKRLGYRFQSRWMERAWRRLRRRAKTRRDAIADQLWLWRHLGRLRNGSATRALSMLAYEALEKDNRNKWGATSVDTIAAKRGRRIARAAADGWKEAWRKYRPPLPHEKTQPGRTDGRVVIGLSGINVAIADGDIDIARLTADEAELACRYAVAELNGFSDWLPLLATHHPQTVRRVLAECIRGEWGFPPDRQRVYEVLHDLRYHGEILAPLVLDVIGDELQRGDPLHHQVLESALAVLLQQPSPPLNFLAALARSRAPSLGIEDPRYPLWLTVWLQTDGDGAVDHLESVLRTHPNPSDFMVSVCNSLGSRRGHGVFVARDPCYLEPGCMRRLVPLVYRHVRVEDDIERAGGGAYTPMARDDAQDFRDGLLSRLAESDHPEAGQVLLDLADDPLLSRRRDWITHLLDQREERLADAAPWEPQDIPTFMRDHEVDPRSDHDLFAIACKRFADIKDAVERADISARYDLHVDDPESRLRSWLARQLRDLSRNRYTVPQEEEIDLQECPDLRLEAPHIHPVSVEIKWADHWTLSELHDGLEHQLVGKYLRAVHSNYGVYVVGYKGSKKRWVDRKTGRRLRFADVLTELGEAAEALARVREDILELKVVGIDFSRPLPV